MVGIITYGVYIPGYRIKVAEIARVWGANAADISGGLGVFEKSVPDMDEDTATIAVEAARNALKRRIIDPEKIGATPHMTAADFEFACKAGTAGIQTCMGMVKSKMITYGLAIGSDVAQGAPSDALEYTAAAGGAAFLIGRDDPIATIHHTCSYTTDTPDFWRREGQDYPRHGGRFTGDPGYFRHVEGATRLLFDQVKKSPKDYEYAVFHQPNAKFPQKVAKALGFKLEQIKPGLVVPRLGNTYSGSSPIGLAATLDIAKPGDRILVTSFGSGAGSDAFDIEVTDAIEGGAFSRDAAPSVEALLKNPIYLDYAQYARHKGKIVMQS
jgi:hydroxymethylglutaryl-CoA synthase